jgi:hypothetical protein
MSIDQNQIASPDFIKNEVQTLGFIKAQTSVASSFPELSAEAASVYSLYIGRHKNSAPTNFNFGCELKMEIETATRSLFIEANVQQNYSLATYALSMCDSDTDEKTLIRKFHFDYDPQGNSSTDKKPKYHLQYGGKTTPNYKTMVFPQSHCTIGCRFPDYPLARSILHCCSTWYSMSFRVKQQSV